MDTINSKLVMMGLSEVLRKRVKSYYAFLWKRMKVRPLRVR
jgi:hypothetical protein